MKSIEELSWDIMYQLTDNEELSSFEDKRLAVIILLTKWKKEILQEGDIHNE